MQKTHKNTHRHKQSEQFLLALLCNQTPTRVQCNYYKRPIMWQKNQAIAPLTWMTCPET